MLLLFPRQRTAAPQTPFPLPGPGLLSSPRRRGSSPKRRLYRFELPILRLDSAFADRIIKGQVLPLPGTGLLSEVPISELVEGQWVCLHTLDNQFLGIGQILDNECVRPKRMLATDSMSR